MAPPFTRSPTCFFCLSPVTPADARAFLCPHCTCWNSFDDNGEIVSDEPAMHDENLNVSSFAKRASPNRDRLPVTFPNPPFCHTCQTNQMLLVNLLSNYLPPPQHPDYAQRLEQLPAYRQSLHIRYPPVCVNCLPAVEDEIEQKNQMARTKALGGWLKQSKRKEKQRGPAKDFERLGVRLAVWRLRGALWWSTLLSVIVAHAAAIRGHDFPPSLAAAIPVLPVFCLISLLYTTWDPTYYRFKKARVQGRDVRVKGKTRYIILQVLVWLSRFATSILLVLSWQSPSRDYLHIFAYPSSQRVTTYCSISLILESLMFSSSFTVLHLHRSPAIRLTGTSSVHDTPESSAHSARASPIPTAPVNKEPDLLASLTLSSKPLIPSVNPIFGHPSLLSPTPLPTASQASPIKVDKSPDENAMDWTPTIPSPVKAKNAVGNDDGAWLCPQRFFPPEHPTGLESLFANTKLDEDVRSAEPTTPVQRALWNAKVVGWSLAAFTIVFIPLSTFVYHKWMKGWIQ